MHTDCGCCIDLFASSTSASTGMSKKASARGWGGERDLVLIPKFHPSSPPFPVKINSSYRHQAFSIQVSLPPLDTCTLKPPPQALILPPPPPSTATISCVNLRPHTNATELIVDAGPAHHHHRAFFFLMVVGGLKRGRAYRASCGPGWSGTRRCTHSLTHTHVYIHTHTHRSSDLAPKKDTRIKKNHARLRRSGRSGSM